MPLIFCKTKDESQSSRAWNLAISYLSEGTAQISLDTLEKAVDTISLEGEDATMPTIAETWIEKGHQKGYAKAKQEMQRQERKKVLHMVLSMHREGSELAFIAKVTQWDKAFLQRFLATAKRLAVVN